MVGGEAQVAEDKLFEADRMRLPAGCGWDTAAADKQGGVPIGVGGFDDAGGAVEVAGRTRADQQPVVGEQRFDVSGQCDPAVVEHDKVVADALEFADDVGGEHDGDAVVGDSAHEHLQELMSGQWVEAGQRLVQDEQVGSLGQGEGKGHLGLLAARQRAGLAVKRYAEAASRRCARPRSKRRLQACPNLSRSATLKRRYSGCSWAT